jgi:hypothetical protein
MNFRLNSYSGNFGESLGCLSVFGNHRRYLYQTLARTVPAMEDMQVFAICLCPGSKCVNSTLLLTV